ncbi:GNAT family N-acetyltransferase [Cohnella abietis]|uniref:N-acetyltransferase n=1 Tax=Cohnella abietis TaxID=2507935 RepID=A0A3T1CYN2_9BACL|nr:GNAT family N-acetyltransferase [Cohnella abietis]BBI30950.1 N-acetyltransferase [Cohnella abietis]
MIIDRAALSDAEEIRALQKIAYVSEAEIYNDYSIEPMVQPLAEVQEQFENYIFLKAVVNGSIVGSVRGLLKERTCHIGKLIVHPNHQNLGIGEQLMLKIESFFDRPIRYELFTGNKSEKIFDYMRKLATK